MFTFLLIMGRWSMYKKMGIKGWMSVIPFYSSFVYYEAITGNGWNMFMKLIPIYGPFIYEYKFMRSEYEYWDKKAPNYAYFLFVWNLMEGFVNPIRFGLLEKYMFKKGVDANAEEDFTTLLLSTAIINKTEENNFCKNCGAEIKKGAKYCHQCGEKV